MLVDPPNGAPVAIPSPCTTNNQSGDQWGAPETTALSELLFQGGGASQTMTELGTGNTYQWGRFSGASGTGPTQVGLPFYCLLLCADLFSVFVPSTQGNVTKRQPAPEPATMRVTLQISKTRIS